MTQLIDIDFGSDLDCANDCLETFAVTSGVRMLAQALYRRITTPRGSVIDAPNYGLDVRRFLSDGLTPTTRATIPGRIAAELLKDERVRRANVVLGATAPDRLALTIRVETSEGPFALVLDVTAAAAKLVEIQEAA